MNSFTIARPHGFRLDAASDFYAGFVPGSGMATPTGGGLSFAFRLDRSQEAVAVSLREEGGANGDTLVVDHAGTRNEATLRAQVERMLGLGSDGHAWLALGRRNPLVGKLQAEFPGFFTAAKPSPYDAATWAVIASRMNPKQAARIKMALSRELGDVVELGGRAFSVFPSPAALSTLESFPGLSSEKVERLRGIARATLDGKLDAHRLRSMHEDDALAELQTLRGVGPWAASHIYYRGAAPDDALPTAEPRVLHGLADAAGIEVPTAETFRCIAQSWRPFRMWVCVLLSRHLARAGGWKTPGLAAERAAAGRALTKRMSRRSAAPPART